MTMVKDIPNISKLLRAVILEDYNDAMDIINEKDFDPNEKTKTWNEPIVSALITILSGDKAKNISQSAKSIFKAIVSHPNFDPNVTDSEIETPLMHIARNKEFNWLAPFILNKQNIDLTTRNYLGKTIFDIATSSHNEVIRDLLVSYNIKDCFKHQPKKKERRIKNKMVDKPQVTIEVTNVLSNIEAAFTEESKENPVSLYNLIKYFIKGNYDECLRIVKDIHFNPNENDRWDEPALSSLIYYSQDSTVKYDTEKFKEIAIEIINNRTFDVNAIDADCNTVLMVAMGFPKLGWLVKELFKISSARIDVVNDMGEDINAIAAKCGNTELLKEMISNNYETATVVN